MKCFPMQLQMDIFAMKSNIKHQDRFGERKKNNNRETKVSPLPDCVKQNIYKKGVALSRDVAFGKKDLVVASLHQVLKEQGQD